MLLLATLAAPSEYLSDNKHQRRAMTTVPQTETQPQNVLERFLRSVHQVEQLSPALRWWRCYSIQSESWYTQTALHTGTTDLLPTG